MNTEDVNGAGLALGVVSLLAIASALNASRNEGSTARGRTPQMRVPVHHADYGSGYADRLTETPEGDVLVFIHWPENSSGVAGGWHDPMSEALSWEDARLLSDLYARDAQSSWQAS
jgi:hypothetical protein